MLDATYIANRVWMGSRPPIGSEVAANGFTMLVLCAQELAAEQPTAMFPGVEVLRAPFDDAQLDEETMKNIASWVYAIDMHLRASPQHRVLVTCNQGRNRSGLVVADYLHWALGISGREAIEMVRRRRGKVALTNPWFVEALRGLKRANRQFRVAKEMGRV